MTRAPRVHHRLQRRQRRLRGPVCSNIRIWQKNLRQQICLGRKISPYILSSTLGIISPYGKSTTLNLLRIAEIHHHPDISLLWNLLPDVLWVDTVCALIKWGLHATDSFEHFVKKIDLNNLYVREKIVFAAIESNNISVLALLNPHIKVLQNKTSKNCMLEAILSFNTEFHSLVGGWGVTSSSNIASIFLFLLYAPDRPIHDFLAWYDDLSGEVQESVAGEFVALHKFSYTPYQPKEFIALHQNNPILERTCAHLIAKWKTSEGFICPCGDQKEMFFYNPCHQNTLLINKLSPNTASIFIQTIVPYIDVKKHFIWAVKNRDFDLASLLLPFLPADFTHITKQRPSEDIYPHLYKKLLSWFLKEQCQSSSKIHICERVKKI